MIDWARVSELRDEVGADSFDEVVTLFLSEVDDVLSDLKTTPGGVITHETMHFLKGCSLNLGFQKLSSTCAQLEIKLQKEDDFVADLSEIETIYNDSKQQFLDQLAKENG
ncbi:Hpt domain-containing protein [Pseudaestuariivita rosea]|uniref:Hpt domain-containing protein n=1 Tax=Pseudaestuariivita rosea TaxID=2763263 RepID=UPI001ABBE27A|nr:Hpt domain-containing protein [Pseudaestuariivita rosea]